MFVLVWCVLTCAYVFSVCINAYVSVHGGAHMEAMGDAGSLSPSCCLQYRSFIELGIRWAASTLLWFSCLCLPTTLQLQVLSHMFSIYIHSRDLNSSTHTCIANALTIWVKVPVSAPVFWKATHISSYLISWKPCNLSFILLYYRWIISLITQVE